MRHLRSFILGLVIVFSASWLGLPQPSTQNAVATGDNLAYAAESEGLSSEQVGPPIGSQRFGCTATDGSGGLGEGTHDVTIAGRPATIIVGQGYNPATPTILAFYLHGDEGGYNFHTSPFNVINQFINDRGWIYVAPQAPPDPTDPNVYPWDGRNGGSIEGNATLVKAVLDEMFAKYNVCRDVLFGAGVSGGSWFYDAYFFPHNGAQYPAYVNLNCGASGIKDTWGSWYQSLVTVSQNPQAIVRSEFKYTIGTDDFLYDNALGSIDTYSALGFRVSSEILPNVGHCAFNTAEKIRDYWQTKYTLLTNPTLLYLPLVIR